MRLIEAILQEFIRETPSIAILAVIFLLLLRNMKRDLNISIDGLQTMMSTLA